MRNNMKTLTMLGALSLPLGAYAGAAESAKVGFEYSAGLQRSDNALMGKTDDDKDQKATMSIGLGAANLRLGSEFGNGNHVHMKFNLLGKMDATTQKRSPALTYGYVHRKVTNQVDIRVGKMLVNQGGFNQRNNTYDSFAVNQFNQGWLWHDHYADALAIDYTQGKAKATLQVLNKPVYKADTATSWVKNEDSGYDFAFQIEADVGRGVTPLFQYVTYDASNTMTVGAAFTQNRVSGSFDYSMGAQKQHTWTGGKVDSKVTDVKANGISAELHYDMGNMTPFFAFNSFTVADAKDAAGKDKKVNTVGYDNNLQDMSFGVEGGKHTDQFRPRLAVSMKSGKWDKNGKEETRSQTDFSIGVYGNL